MKKILIFAFLSIGLISCSKKASYDPRNEFVTAPVDMHSYFEIEKDVIAPKIPVQSNKITFYAKDKNQNLVSGLSPKLKITDINGLISFHDMTEASIGKYEIVVSIGESYTIDIANGSLDFLLNRNVGYVNVVDNSFCYVDNRLNWSNHLISGDGTSFNPYKICTANQLKSLAQSLNSADYSYNYILMNNIDLTNYLTVSNNEFSIGSGSIPFSGVFNGNNLTIKNYKPYNNQSFFHSVSGGEIKNLKFSQSAHTILINSSRGVLIDFIETNSDVNIENIQVKSNITIDPLSNNNYFGLIGQINVLGTGQVYIANIDNDLEISGPVQNFGGIIGTAGSPSTTSIFINYSQSKVNLSTNSNMLNIGGIVGNISKGLITNTKTIMNINGSTGNYIGGIVGNGNNVLIENALSIGEIILSGNVSGFGGIIGRFNNQSAISNSIGLLNITGQDCVSECGKILGQQLSLDNTIAGNYTSNETVFSFNNIGAQNVNESVIDTIIDNSYFFNMNNAPYSNWDFSTTWEENVNNYPSLRL